MGNLSLVVLIALHYQLRKFKSVGPITFSWAFQIEYILAELALKTHFYASKLFPSNSHSPR